MQILRKFQVDIILLKTVNKVSNLSQEVGK